MTTNLENIIAEGVESFDRLENHHGVGAKTWLRSFADKVASAAQQFEGVQMTDAHFKEVCEKVKKEERNRILGLMEEFRIRHTENERADREEKLANSFKRIVLTALREAIEKEI